MVTTRGEAAAPKHILVAKGNFVLKIEHWGTYMRTHGPAKLRKWFDFDKSSSYGSDTYLSWQLKPKGDLIHCRKKNYFCLVDLPEWRQPTGIFQQFNFKNSRRQGV